MSIDEIVFSGERFQVVYQLVGDEAEARRKALDICLEQTVELPDDLVPDGPIRDSIVGRVETLRAIAADRCEAVISYAVESAGAELTQLLNVIFGNISIKPGIRVERLELPESLLGRFQGPRFGRQGVRDLLGVPARPLLCTALKPQGLPSRQLAELAYRFALGGIDIIKDDHGLADQSFAPFRERVQRCAEAVERANRETGRACIYMANVSAPADQVVARAQLAKESGARGLLVAPGLIGLDMLRLLAENDALALPIMSHPAFQGSFVTSPQQGIAPAALFGQLARLAGADATIYPNYGGRFSFSRELCQSIVTASAETMGRLKPIFPTPGGGMSLERVPDMLDLYGREVIFLIGGGLLKHSPDLVENCRYFLKLVEQ
jgi:ribulose-bisphosphate carboxylase large chain